MFIASKLRSYMDGAEQPSLLAVQAPLWLRLSLCP